MKRAYSWVSGAKNKVKRESIYEVGKTVAYPRN